MGDVLLSALTGSAQIQAVTTSTTTEGALRQLPPEIAALPNGSTLSGFVMNRDSQNNPILRTSYGDFMVRSSLFLKTGSEVVLRIASQSGQASAQIVSVDSIPLKTLLEQQQQLQQAGRSDTILSSTLSVGGIANANGLASPVIQAVVLRLNPFGNEAQSLQTIASILRVPTSIAAQLEQGFMLPFRISASSLDALQNPSVTGLTTSASTTAPSANSLASAVTSTRYGAYSKLPAYSPPADASAAAAVQASRNATLSARVIGVEGSETIIRTSIGTLKLFTPSPIPVGSTLQLELLLPVPNELALQPRSLANTEMPPEQRLTLATQLAQRWESLDEAHQMLQHTSSALGADIAARIPNTKSEMVRSALFFLSALRGNDLQRFFGQRSLQQIEERSPRLLQRLTSDFNTMHQITSEAPDSNWQMLLFPLMHGDALQQARLYLRHNSQRDADAEASHHSDTRFVLEVTLSELGAIQIDGLLHGSPAQKLFDITLRSDEALDEAAQEDLRSLYLNAAQSVGFAGQIRFVSGPTNLLQPLQEMRGIAAPEAGSILV